jgi:hypothetical protein
MVFKLAKSAETRWRVLRGSELIARAITGVQFKNGIEVQKEDQEKKGINSRVRDAVDTTDPDKGA